MKAVRGAVEILPRTALKHEVNLAPMSVEELEEKKFCAQDDVRLFAIYESFKRGVDRCRDS